MSEANKLKTLILTNGYGKRLEPITEFINKTMIPIGGKPVLEHVICHLKQHGFKDIIIAVGVHSDQITNYFGNGKRWGVNITYSASDEPQGTAGELFVARHLLNKEHSFLIYYGDILINTDLIQFCDFHKGNKSTITLNGTTGFKIESAVIEHGNDNKVTAFREKPSLPIVTNNPLFCCTHKIWESENIKTGKDFSFDVFPGFVRKGEVSVYPDDSYCYDVGTIGRLRAITELFKKGKVGTVKTIK